MQKLLEPRLQRKIKTLQEIEEVMGLERAKGHRIVQCHGVFDLLHPGHLRHFQSAKEQGDVLVVSITPDRFVNKGPGRPAFTETLRMESLAALEAVDYVVLNDSPDAISAIQSIKPAVYVKGEEYRAHEEDITGKISEEVLYVESVGGKVFYTDDIVFSSSSLLNQHFNTSSKEVLECLSQIKKQHSVSEVLEKIEAFQDLNVLVIGDAILDEYQFTTPLGQSGKGLHMTARCLDRELFLGGALIIANHLAQFVKQVTLITSVGKNCPHRAWIEEQLEPNVQCSFVEIEDRTLLKKRYVMKDGDSLFKLFETYSGHATQLSALETEQVIKRLKEQETKHDLAVVADFGNGFTNPLITNAISDMQIFLALNAQINGGNRGFNVVTNYRRADYISLNEPELRLSAHDKESRLEAIARDTSRLMQCPNISVTRGVSGVTFYKEGEESLVVPALGCHSVDRIGAGDSYLALSSLSFAKKYPPLLSTFIGSVAAAMSIQMMGNQESIKKIPLCKFITRLLK